MSIRTADPAKETAFYFLCPLAESDQSNYLECKDLPVLRRRRHEPSKPVYPHFWGMSDLSLKANKYALAALRERRAELSGQLTKLEGQIRHIKATMVHLDATLRLFDPDRDPEAIRSNGPYVRTKLFGAGKLNRLIFSFMRKGARPMSTAEVVAGMVENLGYGDDAASGLSGVEGGEGARSDVAVGAR